MAYGRGMVFLETAVFTRQVKALLDEDQYGLLQLRLLRELVLEEFG